MKISDGEKLIILMLSELYEKLDVEGEIEPDFIKSAIFSDQLWGIRWKYSGIPFEESEDPEIVKEVVDILDMWSFVERAYKELGPEEKSQLNEEASPMGNAPKFRGFDGNNETEYMGTAMFLVNELERFQEFQGRSFNSHSPSIDMHRRMLAEFEPIRKTLGHGRPMSVDDLTKILKAIIHPSRREA
ncbi:YfbU family protein [Pseudidiomarina sp. 1APR75-33.1]|uniref:YfbU family protein n=1 Tax=Pseudidiomarina terrestris TaxID=2820060 RepID=UPI00264FEC04|nr:YfbU family protein [Pseudidiomarina sp. 1APR75-33.1]MDN7127721.1 YfbU family protein [Pseudidiomarina sp. 1APR75-33.1]